jgi:adenylate kinase family enzyme
MNRVVVLGRGAAGKSVFAARLGTILALPVIELDKCFWSTDLSPTPKGQWLEIQRQLANGPQWILDGDLGPYDVLDVRLQAADTVIVLDFPLWRCAARALRRSREDLTFWRWLLTYRRHSLPAVMADIANDASQADLHLFRSPREVERFLANAVPAARSRWA